MEVVLKVFRWDDDLAVELPPELISQLGLKKGDELEIVASVEAAEAQPRIREQDEPSAR